MKFHVQSVAECLPRYREVLESYSPEWSYYIRGWGWSTANTLEENYEKCVETEVIVEMESLDDVSNLVEEIRNINKDTDYWEGNGVIISENERKEYLVLTIYDGWNE